MQSEQINELASALAIAQGQITGALKDSANPFFKSRYADLASVWDACREHLSKNGLAVIQTTEGMTPESITVVTTLAHKSGQWIKGVLTMTPKDASPQAAGSCLTYARRYALAAIVGVAQVDDDANAASQPKGDRSGRPDTSGLTPELKEAAKEYADTYAKALIEGDNDTINKTAKELSQLDHEELGTDREIFIQEIWNRLSSKQRADLRAIISNGRKAA